MKNYFKDMWVSYAIAFVISYMLFIVEPISMYANNVNDFWFDLSILIKPSLLFFFGLFLLISVIYNVIYFINKKALKVFNVIGFTVFIYMYIQGNYLVGDLPVLDGTPIDWSNYTKDMVISGGVICLAILIVAFSCIKLKVDRFAKISGYITLAVFAMLSVSLISTLVSTDALKAKNRDFIATATTKNIDKYSKNENFIIFLLDATDQRTFSEVLKKDKEEAKQLKDFTYFPDTMSVHPYTQESLPLILTGEVYENQDDYLKYAVNAYKKSELFNYLYKNNYQVNTYIAEFPFNDQDASKISNIINSSADGNLKVNYLEFFKEEVKYDLFRYLPFFLKDKSRIDTLNFNDTKVAPEEYELFDDWHTLYFHEHLKKWGFSEANEDKVFKFIHIEGAHVPHKFTKELVRNEKATYFEGVEGVLALMIEYIDFLKENGVYDNSTIIFMADHGYNGGNGIVSYENGRQNPMFLVKAKGEHHDEMGYSDKPISYVDLQDAFKDLIDGKDSTQLFANIPNERVRRHLVYINGLETHMTEYESKGKAWETEKMYKTGKEFNR